MGIFNILTRTAPIKVFVSLLLGSIAGIGYAFLIPIVINSFDTPSQFDALENDPTAFLLFEISNVKFAALFFISCIIIIGTRTLSQLILSRVAIDTTSQLRVSYYHKILNTAYARLENVGSARLIASITTDVKAIVMGAQLLPDLLTSAVTVVGMMCFLLYLNSDVFTFVCGAIAFGCLTFLIPMTIAGRFFSKAREKVDHLQSAIHGNISGIKELKLSASKRACYVEDVLLNAENDVRSAGKKGLTIMRAATNYGDMISFFVIGIIAFSFVNYHSITQAELLGSVMVLLYITGPISVIMNSAPQIVTANISLKKADKLFADLPDENVDKDIVAFPLWSEINFNDLWYRYRTSDDSDAEGFAVGPLNFSLKKGEVTFIVGGNGSGKSTLAKLITSHYLPQEGFIEIGNAEIDASNVVSYRDQVAAIFTDYHLFDRILGGVKPEDIPLVENYLEKLELSKKVTLKNGSFSTLSLSDGQRKRLALLISLLEDKAIYLFDEWAADQDPEFKHIFYYEVLPHLKSRGKAIVVISHDDRYFGLADQILTMENGKLRNDIRNTSGGDLSTFPDNLPSSYFPENRAPVRSTEGVI